MDMETCEQLTGFKPADVAEEFLKNGLKTTVDKSPFIPPASQDSIQEKKTRHFDTVLSLFGRSGLIQQDHPDLQSSVGVDNKTESENCRFGK